MTAHQQPATPASPPSEPHLRPQPPAVSDAELLAHERGNRRHIEFVQRLCVRFAHELTKRALVHDQSKYGPREAPWFASITTRLKDVDYGTDEYRAGLASIRPAVEHHEWQNLHHPSAPRGGIAGMSLLDVIEMLCDWRAAAARHANPLPLRESIEKCSERFGIGDQLKAILLNTAHLLDHEAAIYQSERRKDE